MKSIKHPLYFEFVLAKFITGIDSFASIDSGSFSISIDPALGSIAPKKRQ